MAKLEGIIYKAFENFVVFRGYAPIGVLAEVSKRPDAYQRKHPFCGLFILDVFQKLSVK